MEQQNRYFRELFRKYLNNQCSEQELREIIEWLKTDQAQENTDDITRELWNKIPLSYSLDSAKRQQKLYEESLSLIHNKTRKNGNRKQSLFKTIYKIAAVFLLFILSGAFYHLYTNRPGDPEPEYQIIASNQGEIRTLQLPDGSVVTLNAGSKLYIPENFNEKQRNIILDGEAFFDVTPNQEKPFHIRGGNTHIQVLGTSFNVKSYKEDHQTAITVSSGKVMVDIEDMETRLNLTQNQHLAINRKSGDFEKKTINENLYVKWMDGILHFEKESLDETIRKIQRCYNKEVILEINTERKFAITGTHDNKSLESVLESVCFTTGLSYIQKDNRIIITD